MDRAGKDSPPSSTQAAGSSAPARVLVVDDDVSLAKATQRILTQMGFDVSVVFDGRSALQEIERSRYDVMLLDLQMASMDGLEVYRAAKQSRFAPEAILHSAYLDVPTTVTAMRAGITEVLEKPVDSERLGMRIRELVDQRRAAAVDQPRLPSSIPPTVPSSADLSTRLRGSSRAIEKLKEQIQRVSAFCDMSVLIEGPTGTGKELVAEAIHSLTTPDEPFVSINCAAVPEQLFESELFGHDAGAFTNARGTRVGLLEEAGRGTIFLDEIGEMPPALQPKLLRVLETRLFRRIGSNKNRRFLARVISATNRALGQSPGENIRADLYFRLAGYTIATPTLASRSEDIPILTQHFLAAFADRYESACPRITEEAMKRLVAHPWPGNVRELRAVVENAGILSHGGVVGCAEVETALGNRTAYRGEERDAGSSRPPDASAAPAPSSAERSRFASLPDLERELILEAFVASGHNLSQAARTLGIPRSTLRDKLRKYGAR